MAVVMFYGSEPAYYLTAISRDSSGRIVSGWVENGAWDLRVTDTEHQALRDGKVVNSWAAPANVREIEVPTGSGGYDDVIARAVEHDNLQRKV